MKEGRYQYQEKIGEGGMATVYKGVQRSLNRPVAIKVLCATLSDNPSVIKRFKQESLTIARLNHPNIIHVIDKGTTSKGRPVFVMEYVEGTNLSDDIRDGNYSFNERVDIAVQICKGVAYAHKLDVIHRDIKPANVIIDNEGHARLLDFGIASFFQAEQEDAHEETQLIMGTEGYMAPEQHRGISETTSLSDIYSIGVVMHELFSGHRPEIDEEHRASISTEITPALAELIQRCLSLEPENRPQTIEEVKTELLLAMKGQHIAKEQASRAGAGLTAIENKFGLLDVMQEDKHGAVYLYEDKVSHNLLVIKKRVCADDIGFREAKLLRTLKHPNLVTILGASKNDNVFIVVMEYVAGGSLQDRLIKPMKIPLFLDLATQTCKGLAFAHKNRIYHGNLRPSNILLTAKMRVKITDFGLDEHYRLKSEQRNWYGEKPKTIDHLSDIYSLGAVFYHALTGSAPEFKDGYLFKSKLFNKLPNNIQHLIGRMLSRDKEVRPPSVEAVLSELSLMREEPKTTIATQIRTQETESKVKTVIEYQRVNWLTITLAVLFVISIALNVALLTDDGGQMKDIFFKKLGL